MRPIWIILISVAVALSIVGLLAYRLALRARAKQSAVDGPGPSMEYLIGDNNLDGSITLADQL